MNSGDTAWILSATSLVMLMTPGVGLFYGGLVRKKNVISIISFSFIAYALVSIQWILVGYSLSFGSDLSGFIGCLKYLGLKNLEMESGDSTVPSLAFVMFQLTFAAISLAILTSGMAERGRLSSFLIFGLFWTTFVYDPLAHWVWGDGWSAKIGALDFAGGTAVHISSGFSALALSLVIGRRSGFEEYNMRPHNIPMTLSGLALLWFGWFGFNAGSALAADKIASNAIVVTNTAAAAGAFGWLFMNWLKSRPSATGMASGALAGLVAITPAAGFVDPAASIVIGVVAGLLCYKAMLFRLQKRLDESLDAWAIHGIGGLWGSIATGIFANGSISGYSGLLYGNPEQLIVQVIAAGAAMIYAFVSTLILAKIVDMLCGLRVKEEEEYVGLDLSQHGEEAYA